MYICRSEVQSCSDNDAVLLSSLLSKYNRYIYVLRISIIIEQIKHWCLRSCYDF